MRVASVDWENTTKYVLNPQRSQSDTLEEALIFYERSSGVKADGTIYAAYGAPKEIQNWSNLQAFINVDDTVYFGFQKDGTLLEYFDCDGTDSPEEMKNLQWIQPVSRAK